MSDALSCGEQHPLGPKLWKNGIALAKYDPDVIVVKVPATLEGVKAANALVADGIRVTLTAAYAPHQAWGSLRATTPPTLNLLLLLHASVSAFYMKV